MWKRVKRIIKIIRHTWIFSDKILEPKLNIPPH